jgi:hypothetical protein
MEDQQRFMLEELGLQSNDLSLLAKSFAFETQVLLLNYLSQNPRILKALEM